MRGPGNELALYDADLSPLHLSYALIINPRLESYIVYKADVLFFTACEERNKVSDKEVLNFRVACISGQKKEEGVIIT